MKQFNKTLWPSILYICFIVFVFSKGAQYLPPAIVIIASFAVPLLVWAKTEKLAKKYLSHSDIRLVFLSLAIPGLLFGFHLAYGSFLMGHGENIAGAIVPISLVSIVVGLITGFVGKVTWEPK